jgi:hypothetical protein
VNGLYSLRRADRSVRLAVALFLLVQGCAYVFAFLMVRTYAGLTPARVAATYAPQGPVSADTLPSTSSADTRTLDLSSMGEEAHVVDADLLIQDSHVHLLIYAIVAALDSLIVLGLAWPAWWRDTVITVAFLSGVLDFSGQWLVKAGLPAFAWLTLASGWAMAVVYLVVAAGAVRSLAGRRAGA